MNYRPMTGSGYHGNFGPIATCARSQDLQMLPLDSRRGYRCHICHTRIEDSGRNASAMLEVSDEKGVARYPIHIGCLNEKIREQTLESN